MAKRVILYEETYDSNTQFNPVTDIESVFHGANQGTDGAQPVGNSIFTNNQETLLTLLSRINSWLYKLKALNDYEVALTTNAAGNKDLALQTNVNKQMSNVRDEISNVQTKADNNETNISTLKGHAIRHADFVNMFLLPKFKPTSDEIIGGITIYFDEPGVPAEAPKSLAVDIGSYIGNTDFKNHYIKITIETREGGDTITTFLLRGDVDKHDNKHVDINLVTLNYDEYENYINQHYNNYNTNIVFQLNQSGVRAQITHFRKTV